MAEGPAGVQPEAPKLHCLISLLETITFACLSIRFTLQLADSGPRLVAFLFFGFGLVFCAFYSISLAVWATWGIIFVFENDL